MTVAAQNEAPERAATASGIIMGLSHGLAGHRDLPVHRQPT